MRSLLPKHFFGRQKAERLVHVPTMNPAAMYGGVYMPSWEAQPYPTPGPGAYAYEGLTQQAQSIYGRGAVPYGPYQVTTPPKVALGTQIRQGTQIGTGTFWLQPLYDPSQGVAAGGKA